MDFLKEQREARTLTAHPTFAEARELYEQQLDNDPAIKPQSRQYRRWCIRKLELSWPELMGLRLDQISAEDMIEFLAYSGMRAFSEAPWVTWEDVDWQRKEIVVRGSPETGTKNREIRRIPLIPDMESLLTRLQGSGHPSGRILQVQKCQGALTRACQKLGIPRITHHDLRHLFATRCIESGVDIPTVARWLGHKDGGALAMKVYGHLRNQHSQEMAKKVRF